jgi:DNA-binding NtrC family response regulator
VIEIAPVEHALKEPHPNPFDLRKTAHHRVQPPCQGDTPARRTLPLCATSPATQVWNNPIDVDTLTTLNNYEELAAEASCGPDASPHLFVVFDAQAPLASASRHAMSGVREVLIGRGQARRALRTNASLLLELKDPRVSTRHARLVLDQSSVWWLEDLGSKNGTFINNRHLSGRQPLHDGAIIEVGQTFLRFRSQLQTPLGTPLDEDATTASSALPGFATLLPPLTAQLGDLARYARTDGAIVLLGETGTGKDVSARACHEASGRRGAFVPVNCGAVPDTLLEALFFGHKRGAFSGASSDAVGLVRAADGGTLFLDELGDLPLLSQAALLRVIETREVTPVGAAQPVRVDVRFIAATHRDIPAMIRRGEFRADLWARLAGHVQALPPLRARREDMGLLLDTLFRRLAPERAARLQLSRDAARALLLRPFPLNVRELVNQVSRALALGSGDVLRPDVFTEPQGAQALLEPAVPPELASLGGSGAGPAGRPGTDPGVAAGAAAPAAEDDGAPDDGADPSLSPRMRRRRAQLILLLEEHDGNVSEVARALGKARPLVYKWLGALGINPVHYRR